MAARPPQADVLSPSSPQTVHRAPGSLTRTEGPKERRAGPATALLLLSGPWRPEDNPRALAPRPHQCRDEALYAFPPVTAGSDQRSKRATCQTRAPGVTARYLCEGAGRPGHLLTPILIFLKYIKKEEEDEEEEREREEERETITLIMLSRGKCTFLIYCSFLVCIHVTRPQCHFAFYTSRTTCAEWKAGSTRRGSSSS